MKHLKNVIAAFALIVLSITFISCEKEEIRDEQIEQGDFNQVDKTKIIRPGQGGKG